MREDISQSITKSFHSSKPLAAKFAGISYTVFMTVKQTVILVFGSLMQVDHKKKQTNEI